MQLAGRYVGVHTTLACFGRGHPWVGEPRLQLVLNLNVPAEATTPPWLHFGFLRGEPHDEFDGLDFNAPRSEDVIVSDLRSCLAEIQASLA